MFRREPRCLGSAVEAEDAPMHGAFPACVRRAGAGAVRLLSAWSMDSTRRDRSIGFLCLGVTAFGWALNWPLMKLLLQQWPPLFARGLAGICASLILGALVLSRKESFAVPREAVPRLLFAT